jgi:NAD(P)-dependent dehydrogenase (short-subunit alcohol dehydrogenase family)
VDVLSRGDLERAAEATLSAYGRADILINGAGGNRADATTSATLPFFELPEEAVRFVFDINLMSAFLTSQVFGGVMARQKDGVILNISSMNGSRPLSRIPAYSAAKAAVDNFTRWLAVHMAQEFSPRIRVNAIAPGFFLTTQNSYLLVGENGESTPRGKRILEHTPAGRFGVPTDLMSTVRWLVSSESSFVTGIVVPVDGGFSAYAGV